MIGFLTGKISHKKATEVIVDVNGVGYLCKIALITSEKIGHEGEEVRFFIHTNVREDDISLYGFLNELEKEIFLKLVSVSGIGAKMALAVQSVFTAQDLLQIVRSGQVHELVKVPGVGKKTAERLILELRDKFKMIISAELPYLPEDSSARITGKSGVAEEAILALEALGYQRKKAEVVINSIIPKFPDLRVEGLLREALKAMR